jgi:inorganic pyrophosphatase
MLDFWKRLDNLIASHELIIDRPKGSRHPRYPEIVYPLDYGYLKGTSAGDGDGIDVWQGSLTDKRLIAVICTVDSHKCDVELKLIIGSSEQEIEIVNRFHNNEYSMSGILIRRP